MVTLQNRQTVIDRDKKCKKCGGTDNLTIDHIVPISRGGTDELRNLQALCYRCNQGKENFLELNIFQRLYRAFYCEEAIVRAKNEVYAIAVGSNNTAMRAEKTANSVAAKIGQIKIPDVSSIQSKADQALSLNHQQTNRVTTLEARLSLIEKYLNVELVEEEVKVPKTVVETIQVKEFRKKKK